MLTLIILVTPHQTSLGSAQSKSDEVVRTGYWSPKEPLKAHYKIECSIDPNQGFIEGTAVISFSNITLKPIQRLAIQWISLGTMEIKSNDKLVTVLGETKNESPYSSTLIELPEPTMPDEREILQIKYSALAPDCLKGEEIRLSSFYPQLWWGFSTHNNFAVKIDMPPGYTLATSGVVDTKTGYYHAENVYRFGLFFGKGHKVIKANAKDVLVNVVFNPQAEKSAHLILDTAVDVINFYRKRFGFYPYSSLAVVPGVDKWRGGYSVATSIVAIHGMLRVDEKDEKYWRGITAHEIGHQYWGEYVLEKDNPAWLWIGLGIYADREYKRARRMYQEKEGSWFVRTYIQGVRDGLDTTINITPEEFSKIKFDFNNVVIHGKGSSIISALDCVLGEEVFDKIYKLCLSEFAGKRLGVHEFRAVCEQETGQDLGWFFDQWVNSNKYLSYEISSKKCEKKGHGYISEVKVKCLGDLKMPVPVTAYFEDGTCQRKFTDRLLDVNFLEFESKSPLKEVKLDANGKLALVVHPPSASEAKKTSAK